MSSPRLVAYAPGMRSWAVLLACAAGGCVALPDDHRGKQAASRAVVKLERAVQVDDFVVAETNRVPRLRASAVELVERDGTRVAKLTDTTREFVEAEADSAVRLPRTVADLVRHDLERGPRMAAGLTSPDAPFLGELHPDRFASDVQQLVAGVPERLGLDRPILPTRGDPQRDTGEGPPPRRATLLERITERVLR